MGFNICEGLDDQNWNSMDAGERFDFIKGMIHSALEDWGYGQVDVVPGTAPGGAEMYYDRGSKEIVVDVNKIGASDYSGFDAASLGIHETLHAMDDQDFGGSYDYGGDQSQSPVHNELHQTALAWTDDRQRECDDEAQSAESSAARSLPPIDWGF